MIFINDIVYGGPRSFQLNFKKNLKLLKISTSIKKILPHATNCVMVISGTKNIPFLIWCKFKKIKIIQRLDGINWQHRVHYPGFYNYIKAEIRQFLVYFIRRYLADKLIYQSDFVKSWWQKYDYLKKKNIVIYNGSEIQQKCYPKKNREMKFICVEGEINCPPMYYILKNLSNLSIDVYGKYSRKNAREIGGNIKFKGSVKRENILKLLPKYDAFLSIELLPACPNSVIEAMSFGLPIIGYSTGALNFIVKEGGLLADYKSNPWKMQNPDINSLKMLLPTLKKNLLKLSKNAKKRHELKFNMKTVTEKYLNFCFEEFKYRK